jgi:hypothetical protein
MVQLEAHQIIIGIAQPDRVSQPEQGSVQAEFRTFSKYVAEFRLGV